MSNLFGSTLCKLCTDMACFRYLIILQMRCTFGFGNLCLEVPLLKMHLIHFLVWYVTTETAAWFVALILIFFDRLFFSAACFPRFPTFPGVGGLLLVLTIFGCLEGTNHSLLIWSYSPPAFTLALLALLSRFLFFSLALTLQKKLMLLNLIDRIITVVLQLILHRCLPVGWSHLTLALYRLLRGSLPVLRMRFASRIPHLVLIRLPCLVRRCLVLNAWLLQWSLVALPLLIRLVTQTWWRLLYLTWLSLYHAREANVQLFVRSVSLNLSDE